MAALLRVTPRAHELGVRMASGPPPAVVALVVRQGMILVGIGLVVGVLGALGLARRMTSPEDPLTFISVTLMLVVVGLGATYIPARRATRIDPMVALRHE